jgi:hypothetical protein
MYKIFYWPVVLAYFLSGCFGDSAVAPKAKTMGDYNNYNGVSFWQLMGIMGITAGTFIILWVIDLGREYFATRKRPN